MAIKLRVGQAAPDFSAPDQHGNIRTLAEFHDEWLLLYFYPKDNTPGCTTEACQLRDNYEALSAQMQVVGVSAGSIESHAKFALKHELPFTLLADYDKTILKAYGVGGIPLAKRTSFLISPEGIIAKVYEKVKPVEHATQLLAEFENVVETIYQSMDHSAA